MYQIGTKNMRIGKIAGAAPNTGERTRKAEAGKGGAGQAPHDNAEQGRALIALEARQAAPRHEPHARHSAPFLAQLLANRIGVPQTRTRRRALPADGSARYAATGNLSCARRIGITDHRAI
jgi:hypothetical protein